MPAPTKKIAAPPPLTFKQLVVKERSVWLGLLFTIGLYAMGSHWLEDLESNVKFAILFLAVFSVILWLSFNVVKHADCLAAKLGEPYGTLVLTLAVVSIEVIMITAVMLTGADNPQLARDTMFSVVMIVLNGVLGLTLLLGGLKHREQTYNLQGTSSYLSMIVPLSMLALVLPRYTTSAEGGQPSVLISAFLIIVSAAMYGVFIVVQTTRHRGYFKQPAAEPAAHSLVDSELEEREGGHYPLVIRSIPYHVLFLVLSMLPVILLAEKMAVLVEHGLVVFRAPQALAGFVVAALVLAPEGLGAIRAALQNQLQRTFNIALGSALSTICLTIPAALCVSLITGKVVELGLEPVEVVVLCTTLLLSAINFAIGRTNVLQGAVHLVLFFTYIVLMFD